MVAVEVETEGAFRVGQEHVLFPAGGYPGSANHRQYDVSPDGQRFLMLKPVGELVSSTDDPVIQILNFFTELEEKVGGRR